MNMLLRLLSQWEKIRMDNEHDFVYVTRLADRIIFNNYRLSANEFQRLNAMCFKYKFVKRKTRF